MNQTDDIIFDDLAPTKVAIKNSEGKLRYYLYEATSDAAIKYRNAQLAGAVLNKETGSVTPGQMANAEALVVAACLREVYDTDKERPVLVQTVLGWKVAFVNQLFDRLKDISPGLVVGSDSEQKQQDEAVKNGRSAGMAISA